MEIWLFLWLDFPLSPKKSQPREGTPEGIVKKTVFASASILLLVLLLASPVSATTMMAVFVSGDGSATSSTGNTFVITPHPLWGTTSGAQWVSAYAGTGYGGGVIMPNSSSAPVMSFVQVFNLPYLVNAGSVTVGADDTAGVWLNGFELKAPNFTLDSACAAGPIACQPGEFMTLDLSPYLVQGMNNLRFDVYQLGGDVTGAIWSGEVTSTGVVPEPSTYALMGAGLAGLALFRRRKATYSKLE